MKEWNAVGFLLAQTTAVSALVGSRIYYGLRPTGTTVPCINYYDVSSVRKAAVESVRFTINCRAATPGEANTIARKVVDLFHGADSTGTYGMASSFTILRAFVDSGPRLIIETEDNIFNSVVETVIVFPSNTVS
jgi:hypothetical protein